MIKITNKMAQNSQNNEETKKKVGKMPNIKLDGLKKKKSKSNFYTSFKLGIQEHSSEEEDETTAIKIFYKEKIATININTAEPFSELIKQIKEKFKIEKFEEKFEIFYKKKEIPLSDGRSLIEIIGHIEEGEYPLFELREKFIKNMDFKDKLYIELENVPSFMDLTSQITQFIEQQKKEVDYELNYWNNIYTLLFSSNQLGFSFISFMTNLKFSNKYYKKLKIDIHFKTVDKIRYENDNEKINLTGKNDSPNNLRGINLVNKPRNKRAKSFANLYNDNKGYYRYLRNNTNFINNSIPYEQEKLMKKIEKAKNKKKWMNLKGFFTSANVQSFNTNISPDIKIHKIKIKNNLKKKSKRIFLNLKNNND